MQRRNEDALFHGFSAGMYFPVEDGTFDVDDNRNILWLFVENRNYGGQ
jgi:hypothetical protein